MSYDGSYMWLSVQIHNFYIFLLVMPFLRTCDVKVFSFLACWQKSQQSLLTCQDMVIYVHYTKAIIVVYSCGLQVTLIHTHTYKHEYSHICFHSHSYLACLNAQVIHFILVFQIKLCQFFLVKVSQKTSFKPEYLKWTRNKSVNSSKHERKLEHKRAPIAAALTIVF